MVALKLEGAIVGEKPVESASVIAEVGSAST
jgi:hypothetical protein